LVKWPPSRCLIAILISSAASALIAPNFLGITIFEDG
jgi:hypothetical protein